MSYKDLEDYRFNPISGEEIPEDKVEVITVTNSTKKTATYKIFSFTLKEAPLKGSCVITISNSNTVTTYFPPEQWKSNIDNVAINSYTVIYAGETDDTYAGYCEFKASPNTESVNLNVVYKGLGSQVSVKNITGILGEVNGGGELSKVDIPGYLLCDDKTTWVGNGDHDASKTYSSVTGATATALGEKASVYGYNSRGYENSVSIGEKSFAEAGNIAIGSGAEAGQANAVRVPGAYDDIISIGKNVKVLGEKSIVISNEIYSIIPNNTVVGFNNTLDGGSVTSLGANNRVGSSGVNVGISVKTGYRGTSIGASSNAESRGVSAGSSASSKSRAVSIGAESSSDQTAVSVGYKTITKEEAVAVGNESKAIEKAVAIGSESKVEESDYRDLPARFLVNDQTGGIAIGEGAIARGSGIAIGKGIVAGLGIISIGSGMNHPTAQIGNSTLSAGKFVIVSDSRDKTEKGPITLDKEFLKKVDFIQYKYNKRDNYISDVIDTDSEGNPIMRPEKKALFDSIMTKSDIVPPPEDERDTSKVDPIVPREGEEGNITPEELDFIDEYNKLPVFEVKGVSFVTLPSGDQKWVGKIPQATARNYGNLLNIFYTVEEKFFSREEHKQALQAEKKIRLGVTAQSVIKALPEEYVDAFNKDEMYLVENKCLVPFFMDPFHITNTNHNENILDFKDGASSLCVDSEDMAWVTSKIVKDIIIELETYETKEGTNQKLQIITDAFNAFSAGELVINNTPTELGISTGDCGTVVGLASKDNGNAKTSVYGCEAEAKGVFASVYGNKARGYEGTFCAGHEAFAEANNIAIGDGAEAGQEDSTRVVDKYENNIALGTRAKIRNKNSLVITKDFTSLKQCATVLGMGSVVLQDWGTSVGQASRVNGIYGVGVGKGAMCENGFSTVVGSNAITRGYNSSAYGYASQAEGLSTTSVGHGSYSVGTGATALGKSAKAIGVISTSLGNGAKANADYSVALGALEETVNDFDIVIGNSASTYARVGSNVFIDGQLYSVSDTRDKDDVKDNEIGLDFINQIKTYSYLKNPRDKYVTRKIIEKKIDTDVELIDPTVPDVEVEEVFDEVEYKKKTKATKKRQLGISAQQIKKLLGRNSKKLGIIENVNRRLANDDDDDEKNVGLKSARLAVNYEAFTPILIKAIQDQSKIITDLENRIKQLEAPLASA